DLDLIGLLLRGRYLYIKFAVVEPGDLHLLIHNGHRCAHGNLRIKGLHILVVHADAASTHPSPNAERHGGAVYEVSRPSELERASATGVFRPGRHDARQHRLFASDRGGWVPGRMLRLAHDAGLPHRGPATFTPAPQGKSHGPRAALREVVEAHLAEIDDDPACWRIRHK